MNLNPAKIISLEEFVRLKRSSPDDFGVVVCTSGGFDPIHPGHLSCINRSKLYGDILVVLVNGDSFLKNKKGKSFMDMETRCLIVSYIKGVDYVIPFEIEDDPTVSVALEKIQPQFFTKGGDRSDKKNIPEWDICQKYGIEIVSGVGFDKNWSSSDFLYEWGEFWKSKTG